MENITIDVRYLFNKREDQWMLLHDIDYHLSNGDKVTVPKGFVTDFASVPSIIWSIVPSIGSFNAAAIIHDYLYENGNKLGYTRKFVDGEFLYFMNMYSNYKFRNKLMYKFVRWFGGKYYKK